MNAPNYAVIGSVVAQLGYDAGAAARVEAFLRAELPELVARAEKHIAGRPATPTRRPFVTSATPGPSSASAQPRRTKLDEDADRIAAELPAWRERAAAAVRELELPALAEPTEADGSACVLVEPNGGLAGAGRTWAEAFADAIGETVRLFTDGDARELADTFDELPTDPAAHLAARVSELRPLRVVGAGALAAARRMHG